MSNGLYQKPTLFAEGDNRITLSAAEQLALRDELSTQIIEHKISGLSQELIYAVFHKTIRYNKREDDLNGICLSNLTSTGSRSDYVNKHVTELIADSIIISRLGTHGRILSINFNFEQWGKSVEYNRENGGLVSDPETLLQTLDIPEAVEEPEEVKIPEATKESSVHTPRGHSVNNASVLQTQGVEPSSEQHSQNENLAAASLSASTLSTLLAEHIPANIIALITEDFIKQALQKLADIILPLLKDNPILELIKGLIAPQEEAEKTEDNTPEQVSTPLSDHTTSPLNKAERRETEGQETKVNHAEEANDYTQLIFPKALKPYEQKQITTFLEKEPQHDFDTVQTVLDTLSSRFNSGLEPIKSPIAYFRKLLTNAQQGDFDRSYAEIYREQRDAQQQQEKTQTSTQERRLHLDKYNEAKNKYEFLKLFTQNTEMSLRAEAKKRKWLDLIEEMGFDLDMAT